MARGDLRFLTVDELELLSVRVRSPNHWTAREVPSPALSLFFFFTKVKEVIQFIFVWKCQFPRFEWQFIFAYP